MSKIRLGTASPAANLEDPKATLVLLEQIAKQAATQKIDILLLPEAFLGGGYPRGDDFGCAIGSRTAKGRESFLQYFRRAVDFGDIVGESGAGGGEAWIRSSEAKKDDSSKSSLSSSSSPTFTAGDGTREFLERVARETGVFLVVGLIERAGGSLYCAAVYVCPQRGILAKRRKVQPTASERLIWSTGGPATLRAVSTTIRGVRINLAAAICWENYMPLLRQALYAQNVNLYLAPTADGRDGWLSLLRTIGTEGRCFVVSSNMCTTSGAPSTTVQDTTLPNTTPGGSAIVSPYGDVIAGPQWNDADGLIYADVDFDDCIRGRLDIDVGGSYSRNDSFKFSVEGLDLSPLPY